MQIRTDTGSIEQQVAQVRQNVEIAIGEIAKVRAGITGVQTSGDNVKRSAEALSADWQGPAATQFLIAHSDTHTILTNLVEQGVQYSAALDAFQTEVESLAQTTQVVGNNYNDTETAATGAFRGPGTR